MPEELTPFAKVRNELLCWGDVCVFQGHSCAGQPSYICSINSTLGHLGIVKLKHGCQDLVWGPGINSDIEGLVRDYKPCLLCGKTGQPAPTHLQPVPWPSCPQKHLQLHIYREINGHGVPHYHQCFLVVVYNLHSKWPKANTSRDRVKVKARNITTDIEPQSTSVDFSTFSTTWHLGIRQSCCNF